MINENIMEALALLGDQMQSEEQKNAVDMVTEMLGAYDDDKWMEMTDDERKAWVASFIDAKGV